MKYNGLNYVDMKKKKKKIAAKKTKIDSEIEKKKRRKMTFGVWSFFWAGAKIDAKK